MQRLAQTFSRAGIDAAPFKDGERGWVDDVSLRQPNFFVTAGDAGESTAIFPFQHGGGVIAQGLRKMSEYLASAPGAQIIGSPTFATYESHREFARVVMSVLHRAGIAKPPPGVTDERFEEMIRPRYVPIVPPDEFLAPFEGERPPKNEPPPLVAIRWIRPSSGDQAEKTKYLVTRLDKLQAAIGDKHGRIEEGADPWILYAAALYLRATEAPDVSRPGEVPLPAKLAYSFATEAFPRTFRDARWGAGLGAGGAPSSRPASPPPASPPFGPLTLRPPPPPPPLRLAIPPPPPPAPAPAPLPLPIPISLPEEAPFAPAPVYASPPAPSHALAPAPVPLLLPPAPAAPVAPAYAPAPAAHAQPLAVAAPAPTPTTYAYAALPAVAAATHHPYAADPPAYAAPPAAYAALPAPEPAPYLQQPPSPSPSPLAAVAAGAGAVAEGIQGTVGALGAIAGTAAGAASGAASAVGGAGRALGRFASSAIPSSLLRRGRAPSPPANPQDAIFRMAQRANSMGDISKDQLAAVRRALSGSPPPPPPGGARPGAPSTSPPPVPPPRSRGAGFPPAGPRGVGSPPPPPAAQLNPQAASLAVQRAVARHGPGPEAARAAADSIRRQISAGVQTKQAFRFVREARDATYRPGPGPAGAGGAPPGPNVNASPVAMRPMPPQAAARPMSVGPIAFAPPPAPAPAPAVQPRPPASPPARAPFARSFSPPPPVRPGGGGPRDPAAYAGSLSNAKAASASSSAAPNPRGVPSASPSPPARP